MAHPSAARPLIQHGEVFSLINRYRQEQPEPPVREPKLLRQRIVRFSVSSLLDALSGSLRISNIPEGAKLLSAWQDSELDGVTEVDRILCLRIEHESFPEVREGGRIPQVSAMFSRSKR